MADQTKINQPGSGPQPVAALRCPEAEPLFTGYLDGTLDAATLGLLEAHLATCTPCADELKLIRRGKEWLQLLHAEDAEALPPAGLAEKILARTTGASASYPAALPGTAVPASRPAAWRNVNMAAVRANMRSGGLMDARLMMTCAMAFFSISITMSAAGIRLNDLRPSNLRHTVTRTYTDTNAHVMRYYENMRVVYELESRVRELRRAAEASDAAVRTTRQPQRHSKSQTGGQQSQPQTTPQSNTSRPSNLSDGVARKDGQKQKKSPPEPDAAPPVTGDVLEANLNFDGITASHTLQERSSAETQRSEA
jgi:hypothetical protein